MGLVMNKLKGIEDKWKLFGSQLGVPSSTLNTIADEKSDDHCLNDVLDMWFDNNYSENNLETLCKALRNVDNKRLANEIHQYISSKLIYIYYIIFYPCFCLSFKHYFNHLLATMVIYISAAILYNFLLDFFILSS